MHKCTPEEHDHIKEIQKNTVDLIGRAFAAQSLPQAFCLRC